MEIRRLATCGYGLHRSSTVPVPAGPAYFQHVCTPRANLSGRAGLRSAERGDLVVLRTATELDKRSFSVAAPVIWNSLPEHLRSFSISKEQFRSGLKTHRFQQAYNVWERCVEDCIELNWTHVSSFLHNTSSSVEPVVTHRLNFALLPKWLPRRLIGRIAVLRT